jgi:hypothetical protein
MCVHVLLDIAGVIDAPRSSFKQIDMWGGGVRTSRFS